MLPYWCLLEVLKFLDRDYLERIQVTNRLLNDIVNQNFITNPLRVMLETTAYVQIRDNEVGLSIRDRNNCFVPTTREWIYGNIGSNTFYPISELLPFLCKNVRFELALIIICDRDDFTPYTAEHIAKLEPISHIWAGKTLYIFDRSDRDSSSLNMILDSSLVSQCRTLYIQDDKHRIELLQNANVFSLYAINLLQMKSIEDDEILQLIQQKASYPQSDTIIVLSTSGYSIDSALETAKQDFLESEDRCRLRIVITTFNPEDISEFRLYNTHTNEVLELKHISKEDVKKQFDEQGLSEPAFLLERCSI